MNRIIDFKKAAQHVLFWMLAATCAFSCSDALTSQPPTDGVAPSPLTGVEATPTPGGAKITYILPKETDISYVKGEFTFQGKPKIVRASVFDDYLTIEGLPSVAPVTVTLWLVDHSENQSTPSVITFTPDTPPIDNIFASLKVLPDFGGVVITWDNPMSLEIGVTFFAADSVGKFDAGRIFFSRDKKGRNVFRPYKVKEGKFGVQITDKWGNTSQIKEVTLTPLLEERLDRLKMRQYILPYDNTSVNGSEQVFSMILDGNKIETGAKSWHTQESHPVTEKGFTIPVLFTIDLGVEAQLNRFLLWQGRWTNDFLYSHHNLRFFEVWATTQPATGKPDSYWHEEWKNDWVMLGDYEIVKPSGLPLGQLSNDDQAAANAGHEFNTLLTPVRYIRFAVKSTWIGNKDNTITLNELEFWGVPEN